MKNLSGFARGMATIAKKCLSEGNIRDAIAIWEIKSQLGVDIDDADAATSYFQSGNEAGARELCLQAFGRGNRSKMQLSMLARISLNNNGIKQAVDLCEYAMEKWPLEKEFYELASEALIRAGELVRAAQICRHGVLLAEDPAEIYARLASIRLRDRNREDDSILKSAAARYKAEWAGHAIEIYLLLKDDKINEAADKCLEIKGLRPDWLARLNLPETLAHRFLSWAKQPLETRHYMRLERRLELSRALFPECLDIIKTLVECFLLQYHWRKASATCALYPLSGASLPEMLEFSGDAAAQACNFKQAANYYMASAIAQDRDYLVRIIKKLAKIGARSEIANLFGILKNKEKTDDLLINLEIFLMYNKLLDPSPSVKKDLWENIINRYVSFYTWDKNGVAIINMLETCFNNDNLLKKLRKNFMLSKVDTIYTHHDNLKPLCFYGNRFTLSYLSELIKKIKSSNIDLVIEGDYSSNYIEEIGLGSYNLVQKNEINNYKNILAEWRDIPHLEKHQRLICFSHEVDYSHVPPKEASAYIYPYESAAIHGNIRLLNDEWKNLAKIAPENKREIAYTGPFHIVPPKESDKEKLRKIIEKKYDFKFDPAKPLVYALNGEMCHIGQLCYCLNRLADSCNVIFKVLGIPDNSLRKYKIDSRIFIISDKQFSNNLLRFAADYILADYFSGTCATSFMLSLPIIPFFSRIVQNMHFPKSSPFHYRTLIGEYNYKLINIFDVNMIGKRLRSYLFYNNLLYDLLGDGIKNLIINNAYDETFTHHLPILQGEIFGDYMREGAAVKTAELIDRYVKTGSFGPDCAAIHFREA